jgi:hypothetical protein
MRLSLTPHQREQSLLWASVAIGFITLTVLAATMPAEGFYSGDSGVKLIASRNAIKHPTRPFDVDLPAVEGRPVPYVDRFFEVHGDHAHVLQSPVFPVLSGFPIAAAGLRGAYILPLVSFIAMLPLLNLIRRDSAPSAAVGVLVVLAVFASPVFFYGLEYWEHAPAIACVAAGTALVMGSTDRDARTSYVMAAAGALGGVAILLRPEALWYVAALAWVSRRQPAFPRFLAGVAAMLVPFATANYLHSGSVTGPHLAANLAPLLDHWFTARGHRIRLWLLPGTPVAALGFLLIGAAWIGQRAPLDQRRRQTLALAGCAVIAVAATRGAFPRDSLWNAWPAGSLALVPFTTTDRTRRLWFLAVWTFVLVWLTSTHDGGAQWGPRFLLIASPALIVLATCAATDAMGPGYRRPLRQVLVVIILIAGVWTTRAAYRELRGTKRYYARIVNATQSVTALHGYVVSDVWWFDQVVAALYQSRTFLYAPDAGSVRRILQQLAVANVSDATLVWTREGPESAPLNDATSGTCYHVSHMTDIQENSLTFANIECSPAPATDPPPRSSVPNGSP